MRLDNRTRPATRPLKFATHAEVLTQFARALKSKRGSAAAHCIHELWMRGDMAINIERMLEQLWKSCPTTIPDWLPMQHIEWLSLAYEAAAQFTARKGSHNIYLVLLDYRDSRTEPYGVYVGMSHYSPAERFDQHKAGIRAAGSVLQRGMEVLAGPTLHLQKINRAAAEKIEVQLAEALTAAGLFVQGGH
jgi:hypothetical protein